MNWFTAVGWAGLGMGAVVGFIAMMWWSMETWDNGNWQEKVGTFAAWAVLIGTAIWFVARLTVPA